MSVQVRIEGQQTFIDHVTTRKSETLLRVRAAMSSEGKKVEADLRSAVRTALGRKTGKAARASYSLLREKNGVLTLRVGTRKRAWYLRLHETGTPVTSVSVKPHVRRLGAGSKFKTVAGPENKRGTKQRVGFEQTAQGIMFIPGHTRTHHLRARRFAAKVFTSGRAALAARIKEAIR